MKNTEVLLWICWFISFSPKAMSIAPTKSQTPSTIPTDRGLVSQVAASESAQDVTDLLNEHEFLREDKKNKNGKRQPSASDVFQKSAGPYNSAIASCGYQKKWKEALSILDKMPSELVTSVTINAAMTTLSKSRRGLEALHLLNGMEKRWNIKPDRISYHCALSAMGNNTVECCRLVQEMVKSERSEIKPNEETFRRIAAAVFGKEKERAMVVAMLGEHIVEFKAFPVQSAKFEQWSCMPKIGRGKSAYWLIGHVSVDTESNPLTVGLQPNRNAAVNGMKLCFYRKAEPKEQKLGYLLMINSTSEQKSSSQFLGQFIDEKERGRGWAKLWLAVWLQLCLESDIQPRTGKIQKPLLCLVLQSSFGMLANEGGIKAELSHGNEPGQVILYSSTRALEGAFSPSDQRKQRILLSSTPMEPRGRPIVVNTSFEWPGHTILLEKVFAVLKGRWEILEAIRRDDLRRILLGS